MKDFSSDLDRSIRQLIRECGQQAEVMAKQQFQVSQKGPDDYVTSVDQALDQKLSAGFLSLFPQDGIITEENIKSRAAFHTDYSRLWLIDPLDGTEDFIQGSQGYSVMVGLLQNAQPIAGWVYAPAQDCMYHGGSDWGLFQTIADYSPERLVAVKPPAPAADFCPILLGSRDQRNFGQAIAAAVPEAQFYSLGSFGLKVMEVILGRAGLYLYLNGRVKLWDTTGPLALARAAGLVCCDLTGAPLSFAEAEIDPDTLAHKQSIVVGWSHYVDLLRPRIAEAIAGRSS